MFSAGPANVGRFAGSCFCGREPKRGRKMGPKWAEGEDED